jgi:hypothetical protein
VSRSLEDLALRRELLVARATLHRAQLRGELLALRRPRGASWVLPLLMLFAGRGRAGSWIARAASLVSIARTCVAVVGALRR